MQECQSIRGITFRCNSLCLFRRLVGGDRFPLVESFRSLRFDRNFHLQPPVCTMSVEPIIAICMTYHTLSTSSMRWQVRSAENHEDERIDAPRFPASFFPVGCSGQMCSD
ncbi:hypothetical protein RBWH47_03723 [Rhodopirellula baltica WH47]|uniref:Uncharacterized protein n=1 Tax=Rhodopirellula baltica WH47 TaxID=991778 RepID=F2ARG5_RHOBT|nr:hypothetical protein RBWH47_03723 [Rhodopirellula baltica WH47]